jgi:transcriptional regulator with XRE-family HTH domain
MSDIFDSIEVRDEVNRFVGHSFDIVDQIHEILEKKNMTQRELAEGLGKRESEVSKWMRGNHNFTIRSIAKIESVLGESLIVTPNKASSFSKPKMVEVKVYARENKPLKSNYTTTTMNFWSALGKTYEKKAS